MMATLPHIDISNTFGAALIGAFISTTLYGLTTLQTYLYYVYYPKDSRQLKNLVGVIWLLDTLQAAFMAFSVYHYLVTSYFDIALLETGHWSLFLSVVFNTVISCIVQMFFVIRIYQLCNTRYRWWVTSVIGALVVAHFAFGVETVVFMFIKKELAKLSEISLFAATPFAVFAVLSDIMIAGALCYLLHGSRSGFKSDCVRYYATFAMVCWRRFLHWKTLREQSSGDAEQSRRDSGCKRYGIQQHAPIRSRIRLFKFNGYKKREARLGD
ncbi:hypothetical protein BDN70DRAFT_569630 [Pholiota conissans]|uniref:Uncharacterized protein n=1 Tax=Pholiota conissans TaxID=109636 RepID=A0A9P6CVT1_9AGAR|nr:hypothetical protein BDN70DRAFT_569630 [Pholiota conissans]